MPASKCRNLTKGAILIHSSLAANANLPDISKPEHTYTYCINTIPIRL